MVQYEKEQVRSISLFAMEQRGVDYLFALVLGLPTYYVAFFSAAFYTSSETGFPVFFFFIIAPIYVILLPFTCLPFVLLSMYVRKLMARSKNSRWARWALVSLKKKRGIGNKILFILLMPSTSLIFMPVLMFDSESWAVGLVLPAWIFTLIISWKLYISVPSAPISIDENTQGNVQEVQPTEPTPTTVYQERIVEPEPFRTPTPPKLKYFLLVIYILFMPALLASVQYSFLGVEELDDLPDLHAFGVLVITVGLSIAIWKLGWKLFSKKT